MVVKIVQKIKAQVKNKLAVPDPIMRSPTLESGSVPPDHLYRYPFWEVLLGDFSLTQSPPAYLQELVVTLKDASTATYTMKLFDESWVTIPTVIGRTAAEFSKVLVTVSFGWSIPGKKIEGLIGSILQVKPSITPDGIAYEINGQFWTHPSTGSGGAALVSASPYLQSIAGPLPKGFPAMKVSELVQEICDHLGIVDPIIEETRDLGQTAWILPVKMNMPKFFSELAYAAKPLEIYLGKKDTGFTQALLEEYRSFWDIHGRYHFHSLGFVQDRGEAKEYFYPYPRKENPVQNLAFADMIWTPQMIAGAFVDPDTGDVTVVEGSAGGSQVRLTRQCVTTAEFVQFAQLAQQRLAVEAQDADLVVLGDISLRPQDSVFITVTPPKINDTDILSHLSGIYMVKDVVHTVNDSGFMTGAALSRRIKKFNDSVTVTGGPTEAVAEVVQHAASAEFNIKGDNDAKEEAKKHIDLDRDWMEKAGVLEDYKKYISGCSGKHDLAGSLPEGVDGDILVQAIMSKESGGGRHLSKNWTGKANKNDLGIMQINRTAHPDWARETDWRDPEENICKGVLYFKECLDTAKRRGVPDEDRLRVAVAGYNAGANGAVSYYKKHGIDKIDGVTYKGGPYSKDILLRANYIKKNP